MAEGFLLLDKPSGITSHDAVDAVRRATGTRKVGHAGTLDPLATGLLVVAVGRVTRLLRFIQGQPKRYEATAVLGVATDSLDADGDVVFEEPHDLDTAALKEAMAAFLGTTEQVPPMVSALKVGGRRLHELARQGEEVERVPRPIHITHLGLESADPGPPPWFAFSVECSTGTYVRVLADDIARRMGTRAHLSALRRTRIGALDVSSAIPVAELEPATVSEHLTTASDALAHLAEHRLTPGEAAAVSHGRALPPLGLAPGMVRLTDDSGRLAAVYRNDEGGAYPEVVLG